MEHRLMLPPPEEAVIISPVLDFPPVPSPKFQVCGQGTPILGCLRTLCLKEKINGLFSVLHMGAQRKLSNYCNRIALGHICRCIMS